MLLFMTKSGLEAMKQGKRTYHFIANPGDIKQVELKDKLVKIYGQKSAEKADIICAIGGDGSLLYALRDAFNKTVIGLCRDESNSIGFWMNRVNVSDLDLVGHFDLNGLVDHASKYTLKPLSVLIQHSDNSTSLRHAFTDAALMSNNGQASLATIYDTAVPDNPWRVMGNGITFATPLGSTAKSYSEGGSAMDISLPAFIMTGSGVYNPLNFKSYIYPENTVIKVDVQGNGAKRDQRIDLDGVTYTPPKGTHITSFEISTSSKNSATLLLNRHQRSGFKNLTRDM